MDALFLLILVLSAAGRTLQEQWRYRKPNGIEDANDNYDYWKFAEAGGVAVVPRRTLVRVGDQVILPCQTSGNLPIRWTHNPLRSEARAAALPLVVYSHGKMAKDFEPRFSVGLSGRGFFDLSIRHADIDDSGMYVCEEGQRQHANVELLVSDEPQQSLQLQAVGVVGETVTLGCNLKTSDWLYQSSEHHRRRLVSESGRITAEFGQRFQLMNVAGHRTSLRIYNVQPDDAGIYQCTSSDDFRRQTHIRLLVFGRSADVRRLVAFSGERLSLQCRSSSPDTWRLYRTGGGQFTVDRICCSTSQLQVAGRFDEVGGSHGLTIERVDERRAGVYECVGDGRTASVIHLDVYGSRGDVRTVFGRADDRIELRCDSPLSAEWSFARRLTDGFRPVSSTDDELADGWPRLALAEGNGALVIRSLRSYDAGYYTCAQHGDGDGGRTIVRVIVGDDRNLTKIAGDTFALFHEIACGSDVYCYYQTGPVSPVVPVFAHGQIAEQFEGRFHARLSTRHGANVNFTLWVENAKLHDSGIYVCAAEVEQHREYRTQLFVSHVGSLTATLGQVFHIVCPTQSGVSVSWYYQATSSSRAFLVYANGQLMPRYRGSVLARVNRKGQSVLSIDDIQMEDSGLYSCSTDDRRQRYTVQLIVSPVAEESRYFKLPYNNERPDFGQQSRVTRKCCE